MDGHDDQQNSRIILHALVATVGFLSAALGFAAEATKLQLDEVKDTVEGCSYPRHPVPAALAGAAAVALLGFRVYCPGIRSASSAVLLSRYLSWVAWFVAISFYVVGLLMINNQGGTFKYDRDHDHSYYKCNIVKPGIFGAGASFALTSIVLEVVYLVVTQHQTEKTVSDPSTDQRSIIAMS